MEVSHFPPPPICALSLVKQCAGRSGESCHQGWGTGRKVCISGHSSLTFFRSHNAVSKSFLDERSHARVSWRHQMMKYTASCLPRWMPQKAWYWEFKNSPLIVTTHSPTKLTQNGWDESGNRLGSADLGEDCRLCLAYSVAYRDQ